MEGLSLQRGRSKSVRVFVEVSTQRLMVDVMSLVPDFKSELQGSVDFLRELLKGDLGRVGIGNEHSSPGGCLLGVCGTFFKA